MRVFQSYARLAVAMLLTLSGSVCAAQNTEHDRDAFYFTIRVPGAIGTYPMALNNSLSVTGYYLVSPGLARAFVVEGNGRIITFSLPNSIWTEPESINSHGDITGFYELVAGFPLSFIRYADGRILTFVAPCENCTSSDFSGAQPISINDDGVVAGNYLNFMYGAPADFQRSANGAIKEFSFSYDDYPSVVTGQNANGTIVGFFSIFDFTAYSTSFTVDSTGAYSNFRIPGIDAANAEAINLDGAIAGWYHVCTFTECDNTYQGFVRSPDGAYALFSVLGSLAVLPVASPPGDQSPRILSLTAPHGISLNRNGTVSGSYVDMNQAQHGFIRESNGALISFDPPHGKQTTATSINDFGVVAGTFYHDWNKKNVVGFLRIPRRSR